MHKKDDPLSSNRDFPERDMDGVGSFDNVSHGVGSLFEAAKEW